MKKSRIRRSTRNRKPRAGSSKSQNSDHGNDLKRALAAEQILQAVKKTKQRLAIGVLSDCMVAFNEVATAAFEQGDLAEFEKWSVLAIEMAEKLLPYQTKKIGSIDCIPGPRETTTTVDEEATKHTDQDPPVKQRKNPEE
jgi:hypothetical protein